MATDRGPGCCQGLARNDVAPFVDEESCPKRETEFSRFEWIPDPVDPASQHDTPFDEEQLQATLLEMPETFRLPVLMFYFEDLSYQEIAERLEVPIGTVMSRLSRGKAFLRDRLRDPEPNNIANAKQRSPSPGPAPTETVKPFES